MKFDLNGSERPPITIEERYARETTNDIGDPLTAESAYIIFTEFKKFMYLVAVEIYDWKENQTIKAGVDGEITYFESPLSAPPYLDRIWKLFILYHDEYSKFCDLACRGYIDWVDPRFNLKDSYKGYQQARKLLIEKKDLLKPFMNLWPDYRSE